MRTIGVVTVGRSDYGIYLPVLRRIEMDPGLRLRLIVSGAHLSPEFGRTVEVIEADGFEVAARIEMLLSSDSPEGVSKSMGLGMVGFAQAYASERPDLLLVLGDRFEMFSAVAAAMPFNIPVAHIHGGERTEGAIDESIRHAITKMSHLHFVATEEYRRRVMQLGEADWRITVSGAPSLDNLQTVEPLGAPALEQRLGLKLDSPPLLVTFHPVTLQYEDTESHIDALLGALDNVQRPIVFTFPNPDTAGRSIIDRIARFVGGRADACAVHSLGTAGYFGLMTRAAAMVGNSSSGIIESPSFELPVVNVGDRQAGRVRATNVIDTGYARAEIRSAIDRALSREFRESLRGLTNPYGDGQAAGRIVAKLSSVSLDRRLLVKPFQDIPTTANDR